MPLESTVFHTLPYLLDPEGIYGCSLLKTAAHQRFLCFSDNNSFSERKLPLPVIILANEGIFQGCLCMVCVCFFFLYELLLSSSVVHSTNLPSSHEQHVKEAAWLPSALPRIKSPYEEGADGSHTVAYLDTHTEARHCSFEPKGKTDKKNQQPFPTSFELQ